MVLDKIKEEKLDVTIIGGTRAVSTDVESVVRETGVNVNRIAGESQEETAVKVAERYVELAEKQGINIDSVMFVNWNDRKWYDLSQGAKLLNYVILYTDKSNSIPQVSKDFLDSRFGINKVFIVASNEKLVEGLSDDEQYLKTVEFKPIFPKKGILAKVDPVACTNLIVDKIRTKLERAGMIFAPMKVVGAGGGGGGGGGGT